MGLLHLEIAVNCTGGWSSSFLGFSEAEVIEGFGWGNIGAAVYNIAI